MALVHNALQRATALMQGIRRVAGIDVASDGTERLGETLTPVLDVWGRHKPEHDLPRGEIPLWRGYSLGSAAGTYNKYQLYLPPESGRLCVIEGAWISLASNGDVVPYLGGGAFATIVGGLYQRDMRASSPLGHTEIRQLRDATTPGTAIITIGAGGGGLRFPVATDGARFVRLNIVLMPGFDFYLRGPLNVAMDVLFFCYERDMLPGERLR